MNKMGINRRKFLKHMGLGSAATYALLRPFTLPDLVHAASQDESDDDSGEDSSARDRRQLAKSVRERAASIAFRRDFPNHKSNNEEKDYPYVATYTKGLPHNDLGEVNEAAYRKLLNALASQKQSDFEKVTIGDKRLKNPMGGLTYELEGGDPQQYKMPPAPRIDGAENSAEMAELYWEALCRDVPFHEYQSSALIAEAAADMSRFSKFKGPKNSGQVDSTVIFRGEKAGDLIGPYLSQFLLQDIPFGVRSLPGQLAPGTLSQRYRTTVGGLDFLTSYGFFLHRNSGGLDGNVPQYDSSQFFVRNGRDLANLVQIDVPYQFGINAAYILLSLGIPYAAGNPYRRSLTMDGFVTFSYPHIIAMVVEASVRAARAVWFQKWFVHRRLRPETFGCRIHNHVSGKASYPMINSEILNSPVLQKIADHNMGQNLLNEITYLLPQAYPEGSPLHPAYASGHATMIGAAVTILKAFFDESVVFPNPVDTNSDGTALVPYAGADAGQMTVGGELDKLASNIAMGRNWAGIHWRTDMSEGNKLGEAVAMQVLKECSLTYPEKHSFKFTSFAGRTRVLKSRKNA